MLYTIAHFIQEHISILWAFLEKVNDVLFMIRYGKRIRIAHERILSDYPEVSVVSAKDVQDLAEFFVLQPDCSFTFFRPHGFDADSLLRLVRRKSFLMYLVRNVRGRIDGYFFLRSFFVGKAYLGKIVDCESRRKGIGKVICCCAMDLATMIDLKMYESISKDNIASLRSTQSVLETEVVKEMSDNYILIEDIRKK